MSLNVALKEHIINMKTAIIIPARYGSTRFPGKPLALIGGQTMLSRVVTIAKKSAQPEMIIAVATDDQRIANHATEIDVTCIMTSDQCVTGSDRVLEAIDKLDPTIEFVFSLQGDAPFTPPQAIKKMIDAVQQNPVMDVITPVINLRWSELDKLREQKKVTPFSGTTCIRDQDEKALWFSKTIIPAIREEENLRDSEYSPVFQHIGLYGYKVEVLHKFVSWPQGYYETLEGLEQLRFLENNVAVHTIQIDVPAGLAQAGIDSPEDIERAEKLLTDIRT